jgi:hypothetical protein
MCGRKVLRSSKTNFTLKFAVQDLANDLVIEAHHVARGHDKRLASGSKDNTSCIARKQGRSDLLFEALNLKADRRLRPSEPRPRPGKTLSFCHREERAEQIQIQIHKARQ